MSEMNLDSIVQIQLQESFNPDELLNKQNMSSPTSHEKFHGTRPERGTAHNIEKGKISARKDTKEELDSEKNKEEMLAEDEEVQTDEEVLAKEENKEVPTAVSPAQDPQNKKRGAEITNQTSRVSEKRNKATVLEEDLIQKSKEVENMRRIIVEEFLAEARYNMGYPYGW